MQDCLLSLSSYYLFFLNPLSFFFHPCLQLGFADAVACKTGVAVLNKADIITASLFVQLATKANVTAVDAKADKSYVDDKLAGKASADQLAAMQTKIDDLTATMAAQDRRIKDLEDEKQKVAKQASNRAALIQAVQDSLAVVDAKASVEMPAHESGEPVPGARANFQLTCGGDVMFDAPEGKQVVFGQSEESVMVAIDPAQGNVNIHGKVRTKGCADGVCEKVTELVSVINTLLEALKE